MRTLVVQLSFSNMPRQTSPDADILRNLTEAIQEGPDALYALMEREFTVTAFFTDNPEERHASSVADQDEAG